MGDIISKLEPGTLMISITNLFKLIIVLIRGMSRNNKYFNADNIIATLEYPLKPK